MNTTLADLPKQFPALAGRAPELAGFIWFQGWNDMISVDYTAALATNLAHFIRDVRKDFKSPKLPFVIAQMGVDGTNASKNVQTFKAVLDVPEFSGNVALVKTDGFWDYEADAVFRKGWRENLDEWNKVGSARTLCRIGRACAEAVMQLRGDIQRKP